MIPVEQYSQIIEILPILCVDIVVTNSRGEYLLVKRANEPRKGQWWVIGGRVLKGETLERAAMRKIGEEVSLDVERVHPLGYYEAVSQENPFGCGARMHAVSIVFSARVDEFSSITLDGQSTEWKYSPELPPDFHFNFFVRS
jgi:colanic acid biosynthesis protein WcaH